MRKFFPKGGSATWRRFVLIESEKTIFHNGAECVFVMSVHPTWCCQVRVFGVREAAQKITLRYYRSTISMPSWAIRASRPRSTVISRIRFPKIW